MGDLDLVHPDDRPHPKYTASLSLNLVMKVGFLRAHRPWPRPSRTTAPFRSATIRFLNSSGERRSVFASRLT
jgi:hypothetical protein